jgi:hypothetical protein
MPNLLPDLAEITPLAIRVAPSVAHGTSGVEFVTPMPGVETTSKVTFTVELRNFELDAKDVGEMKAPQMGHLHFSMDKGKYDHPKYSGVNGKLAEVLGTAGKYSPAVMPTITYSNLPKGEHTLVVMLANNDESLAGPQASVTFTVK